MYTAYRRGVTGIHVPAEEEGGGLSRAEHHVTVFTEQMMSPDSLWKPVDGVSLTLMCLDARNEQHAL